MMGQSPVANFGVSVFSGCAPLIVTFTDQSTGSPTSWNWDFGPMGLRTGPGPQVVGYGTPGTYSVTLTVRNANGINSITKTDIIVVNPSPSPNFTADKTLSCLPASTQFTDLSVANAGTITQWYWDFGDGTPPSTAQNPKHTYTDIGYYSVYLSVTSSTGCKGATSASRYIRMVNGVKADFNAVGPSTCQPPFTVDYPNLTSGPGNLTYNWNLGNATTSTQISPTGTYATPGTYNVKLVAQSDFGCSDSITKPIPITGITTSFQSSAVKDSSCIGIPITFQNTSSVTPISVTWDFGDGTTFDGLVPPAKTYAAPGNYTVTMNASYGNCSDIATKTIVVSGNPTASFFSSDNNSNCKTPATVNFQNLSGSIASALWDFGDGQTLNSANPSVSHVYNTLGNFAVTLTVKNSEGCSNTLKQTNYVNILTPVVNIIAASGVCEGQGYNPSPDVASVDGALSYAWDFGDASPINNAPLPVHIYPTAGVYTVKLTVTTNGGCIVSTTKTVTVGKKPVIDFVADKTGPCASDSVKFTNLSTPAGYNGVVWDFGDGTTLASPSNPVSHKFVDTGYLNIKLKLTSNGCTDSLIKPNYVFSKPPVANFGYRIDNCINYSTVTFLDSSKTSATLIPPPAYLWKFGVGGNTSTVIPPAPVVFTYPTGSNAYNATLIVSNGGCTDSIVKKIQIVNETAKFTINKSGFCRNEQVVSTSGNTAALIKKYEWIIDGASPVTGTSVYTTSFTDTGKHTIMLTTTDVNNCVSSSILQTVAVTGPTALFSVTNNGGCKNNAITFNDLSKGAVNKWIFDFGDGKTQTFTAPPFTHVYADTGSYSVKLTVFDIGCQDTFRLPTKVVITKPVPAFKALQANYCPGIPIQFTDSSKGKNLVYAWSFGDGGTAAIKNPVHTYNGVDSSYTVKLVVTDSIGCADSITKANYVTIKLPKASFTVKDTATLCPPLESKFTFTGKDYASFIWDFGDGSPTSTKPVTSHFYNSYGIYTAKVYAFGNGGCVDSASQTINVTNPYYPNTQVTFSPNTACNELTSNFNVIPPFGATFLFYFGDGASDSGHLAFSHFYNLPNAYSPYLVLKDSVGCQVTVGGLGVVDVKGAIPIFGKDKKAFCDSGTVYFTDYSQGGADPIVKRTWDFGDGSPAGTSSGDTIHTYKTAGFYTPTLTVTSTAGCDKTFTDTVRVLATPTPIITSQDAICTNLIVDFAGSLAVPPDTAITWKWDLSGGLTSNKQNVSVNYPDTGIHHIKLEAINSLGCKGDTTKDIIIYPLPVISVTGDTVLIAGGTGQVVPLSYSANATTFNWTPDKTLSCIDCPNPFATPKFTTTYKVQVTDANGCISSRTLTLIVLCNDKNFFIPNTFSPNNDGANDRFYPRGRGLERIQALRIFNRWGELVFEKRNFPANDPASGWDGTYKGKSASSDTYVYMIDIICENANIITYKGNITLIR